jgi:hypothetical protein
MRRPRDRGSGAVCVLRAATPAAARPPAIVDQPLEFQETPVERRDLYDIRLAALFLDAVSLSVRRDGPKEPSWSPGGSPKRASACCFR